MTVQIGATKPPAFYTEEIEEHLRQIVGYLTATGDRANETTPKDGSELSQMVRLDSLDAAITQDAHNAPLPDHTVYRLDPDAAWDITGIEAEEGRLVILFNVGAFTITLLDQDGASTDVNRFELAGSPYLLLANTSVILWYDATTERWRKIAP